MDSSLIPTLSEGGLILLSLALAGAGAWMLLRRTGEKPPGS